MKALMGFTIYDRHVDAIDLKSDRIINTINPHSYCMTLKDSQFKTVLQNSDILLPDGIGIVWASKVLHKTKIKKIAGYDIFMHLMTLMNESAQSCFFMGASEETLQLIKARAAKEFPKVQVNSYSPPYKESFSATDNEKIIQAINAVKPTVLFVGMTAPKQEKWAFEHKNSIQADVICSIGAVFDFYAGTVKRSGNIWIKLGLEWLPRFLKEPRRLAERNLVSTPKFIYEVLSYKLKKS